MSGPELITFGCRLNAFESEVMKAHAVAAGLGDAVVVNTCAVTAEAVRQAAQAVRKARRERPQARIVVTGCAAQTDTARFAAMPEVDHVLGNGEKMRREAWTALADPQDGPPERLQVGDIMALSQTAHHLIDGFSSRARAYVEIQNGCDHRCTFCIIPYGRGPSRSVPPDAVITQVRRLAETGYAEVVLTGVDITSYAFGDLRLGGLVRRILREVPELRRLRLSSIDSVEADRDLMACLAEEERLMPHLHLSLQSGDDLILKRMKRRHLRAEATGFCHEARRLRPDLAIGADLIAGFPTETEAMHEASERLVEDCGLTFLHVFPFSPRPGTPAARMPQVDRQVIKERAARLRAAGDKALATFLGRQSGRIVDALVERPGLGRTRQFAEVTLEPDAACEAGSIVEALVHGHDGRRLTGEMLS